MPSIANWPELLTHVAPHLKSAQPLTALREAGFTFAGPVADAIGRVKPSRVLKPGTLAALEASVAQAPPIRMFIGRPVPPAAPPPPAAGFRATAGVRLGTLNPVLAQLWQVGTFPRSVPADLAGALLSLGDLAGLCTGVSTGSGAALGALQFTSPPVLSANAAHGPLHLSISIALPVTGPQPSSLLATVEADIPLGLAVAPNGGHPRLQLAEDATGTAGANARLVVSAASSIQPKSAEAQDGLDGLVTKGLRGVLLQYTVDSTLSLPASYTSSTFPNTTFSVNQEGAATFAAGSDDYAILGVNIVNAGAVNPLGLAAVETPRQPQDVRLVIGEALVADALQKVIHSGDLLTLINSKASAYWEDSLLPGFQITGSSAVIQNGTVTLSLGLRLPNACFGLADIDFTATLSGPPKIANGMILIDTNSVDIDISNWDYFICSLLSAISPILEDALQYVFHKVSGGHDIASPAVPALYSFTPLSISETDWTIEFKTVSAYDGALTLDGVTYLTPDQGIYVYLRLVSPPGPGGHAPIANAKVMLYELDDPAPAGDDVKPPKNTDTTKTTPKFIFETSTVYMPGKDQLLGTQTTDETGLVVFAVSTATLNNVAGTVTTRSISMDVHNATVTSDTTATDYVSEGKPDYGITVTDSAGVVIAQRKLVALNAVGKRIGTHDAPIVVALAPATGTRGAILHP